ncbi:MAG: DoxX family membrane protein [Bacteroidetes bacterium]|nr:DoxX family membrane protein [Bacteroidota bacterium]
MKSLFQTGTREEYLNILVLILRISIAAFMLTHGWPKLGKLLAGGEIQFGDPIGLGPGFSLILAVFAEVALLYLLFYIIFFVTGGRKYSIDHLLTRSS